VYLVYFGVQSLCVYSAIGVVIERPPLGLVILHGLSLEAVRDDA
jgi:hypothetical protein